MHVVIAAAAAAAAAVFSQPTGVRNGTD